MKMTDEHSKVCSAVYPTPILYKNQLNWEPQQWREEQWVEAVNQKTVTVRVGSKNPRFTHPHWERYSKVIQMDTKDLFSAKTLHSTIPTDSWVYYDYKYMTSILHPPYLPLFSWSKFGYPGRDGCNSTPWVGSEGAHTPCHQDTYGENLVGQVVGTKTWILFPPEQGHLLCPTRVPYEESSIYSNINFVNLSHNSTSILSNLNMTTPYMVTLHPGDVLYVPRHWWHHVYSNQFSISVNTWIEHQGDKRARLGEALVRCQVAQMVRGVNSDIRNMILNPNEDDVADTDMEQLASICNFVAKEVINNKNDSETSYKKPLNIEAEAIEPSKFKLTDIKTDLPKLDNVTTTPLFDQLATLINAVTHPDVIEKAVSCYLSNLNFPLG